VPEKTREPKDAATQAREALERARAAAKSRGSTRRPAGLAARERRDRQSGGIDRTPYGRGREPTRLGDEIARVFESVGGTDKIEMATVARRWGEVVGEEIANHTEILSFDGGVLVLRASSTAWAEQLVVVSGRIKQRLNEEIGRRVVSVVRVERPTTRSWVKGQRTVKGRGARDTYG